jgi:hypothetical protein
LIFQFFSFPVFRFLPFGLSMIFAQALPPPLKPPPSPATFPPQVKSAPPVAQGGGPAAGPSAASSAPPKASTLVGIKTDDFLDHLGFSKVADVAVMTALALITGAILAGVLLAILRRAFTSIEEQQTRWEAAEKMWLDLTIRKARAHAEIEGIGHQIDGLRKRQEA